MTNIALFHSVLGVREGVRDAAERLREAGHDVHIVDQYDGRVFDDYDSASAFAEGIGYPVLMQKAVEATTHLSDGFIVAGFSNGGAMAEYVATRRKTGGVLMFSGALPLDVIGISDWPSGVAAQIHYAIDDPFRDQNGIDAVAKSIRAAGASVDIFNYPGRGHLFTDRSLPDEYDAKNTEILWQRVIDFCASSGQQR
ncbi:dienelactone hydrolase family protein [Devosia algicola]|uniref:Dienelactone hydrolase family protein n=1 Tax=Devosia algicola TaxID=3026418 RepID=A0ABY7YP31_9HYPH|nr:dienelactone hydrolase family protein [Devosia algicola]WDR03080.1 dienelactone hydrolase family protein [Devosia algicola]